METSSIIAGLRSELEEQATPEHAEGEKRYLKSDLDFIGATVPVVRRAAKRVHAAHPRLDHEGLRRLVAELWDTGVFELRMASVVLLDLRRDTLDAGDIGLLERLLRESKTWALVDSLCTGPVGALVDRERDLGPVLDRWARDEDFWMRRSALLVHLRPLASGGGDFERFTRYADAMLEDREFFIRKAIGWVLRDTARRRPGLVAGWVGPRTHRISGVTIREAVKRLPPEQAEAFMTAYREKRPAV